VSDRLFCYVTDLSIVIRTGSKCPLERLVEREIIVKILPCFIYKEFTIRDEGSRAREQRDGSE